MSPQVVAITVTPAQRVWLDRAFDSDFLEPPWLDDTERELLYALWAAQPVDAS